MKSYNVGVILSTSYVVEADSEEQAKNIAYAIAEDEYQELNVEEANFVELFGETDVKN